MGNHNLSYLSELSPFYFSLFIQMNIFLDMWRVKFSLDNKKMILHNEYLVALMHCGFVIVFDRISLMEVHYWYERLSSSSNKMFHIVRMKDDYISKNINNYSFLFRYPMTLYCRAVSQYLIFWKCSNITVLYKRN